MYRYVSLGHRPLFLSLSSPLSFTAIATPANTPAVIIPRVQVHFNLSAQVVGLLSASTMAGVSYYSHYIGSANKTDDAGRGRLGCHFRPSGPVTPFQLYPLPHCCIRRLCVVCAYFSYLVFLDVPHGVCSWVSGLAPHNPCLLPSLQYTHVLWESMY
jgi:hypothetical protein